MVASSLVLGLLAAFPALPSDQPLALRVLEIVAIPLELALIGWVGWRAARALRTARLDGTADTLEQLRRAARDLVRNDRVAAVLASELAVVFYALGSWRARAHQPPGSAAFNHHERSGHAGVVLAIILVLSVEGLAMHFLLLRWSAVAAWVFTASTAYLALWLIADHRAMVLRPILIGEDGVLVRAGLRFTVHVPWSRIAGVDRTKPPFGRESANLTLLGTPSHWITLSERLVAEGPYGSRRPVRAIGIEPDAAPDFDRALAQHLG